MFITTASTAEFVGYSASTCSHTQYVADAAKSRLCSWNATAPHSAGLTYVHVAWKLELLAQV